DLVTSRANGLVTFRDCAGHSGRQPAAVRTACGSADRKLCATERIPTVTAAAPKGRSRTADRAARPAPPPAPRKHGRGRVSVGRGRIGGVAETVSKKTEKTSGGGRPRLMLMDGHSLAYRAFFALPAENFTTATGQPTNAIYGFASMLANTLRDEAP